MGYIEGLRKAVGNRPLILVASAVMVMDEQDKVLLQHRVDTQDWGIPGGFMELGETVEEAARRELLEETGLTAGQLNFFEIFSGEEFFYTYPNGDQVYNVIVSFLTKDVRGQLEKDHEGLELRYFSLDQLPGKIITTSKRMLDALKERFPPAVR
ncbi:NUDIX hydrolase [Ammoniphilus sp. YIM 78166]|uniref:NUDIX hydrolase n=1 Tax=Ammoniphilus sp. YIM 78166 TaxID=1644106 RepID=UPI00106F7710|nr:NUDIX hydrolase [Ammoniphilus sp. YIM 78166]